MRVNGRKPRYVVSASRSRPPPSARVALAVLPGEAERVDHLVGLLHVVPDVQHLVLGPREVQRALTSRRGDLTETEHERLVDRGTVDAVRQRNEELARAEPPRDLRILVEALVAEEAHVGALVGRVQVDPIVALLLVLQQHRELAGEIGARLGTLREGPRHQAVGHMGRRECQEPGLQHAASCGMRAGRLWRGLHSVVIAHERVLSRLRPIRRQLWRRMSCSGKGPGSPAVRPAIRSSNVAAAARPSSSRGTRTVVSGGVTRLA